MTGLRGTTCPALDRLHCNKFSEGVSLVTQDTRMPQAPVPSGDAASWARDRAELLSDYFSDLHFAEVNFTEKCSKRSGQN